MDRELGIRPMTIATEAETDPVIPFEQVDFGSLRWQVGEVSPREDVFMRLRYPGPIDKGCSKHN